jgi:hypothetical protein
MSYLLDVLKNVVTHENVNCVPSDFSLDPHGLYLDSNIYFVKMHKYGFINLALIFDDIECVDWILSNFSSSICFESITIPESYRNYDLALLSSTPLLEWCAKNCSKLLVMFLEAGGARVNGAEKAFNYIAREDFFHVPRQPILERMLQLGIGIKNTLQKYECSKWVHTLVEDYRCRRKSCKTVVVRLIGLIKFKRAYCFPGLDSRLLKQMIVTPVWETRYSECWNNTEVKKLKI